MTVVTGQQLSETEKYLEIMQEVPKEVLGIRHPGEMGAYEKANRLETLENRVTALEKEVKSLRGMVFLAMKKKKQ